MTAPTPVAFGYRRTKPEVCKSKIETKAPINKHPHLIAPRQQDQQTAARTFCLFTTDPFDKTGSKLPEADIPGSFHIKKRLGNLFEHWLI